MAEPLKAAVNPSQPPKEMSMEMRLLLAFLLMGAVMFVTPYFLKYPQPPRRAPPERDRGRARRRRPGSRRPLRTPAAPPAAAAGQSRDQTRRRPPPGADPPQTPAL